MGSKRSKKLDWKVSIDNIEVKNDVQDELSFFNSNRIKTKLNLKHISNNCLDPKSEFFLNNLQDIDSFRKISQSLAKSWVGNFELKDVKKIFVYLFLFIHILFY